jgi:hypothetical protein
MGYAYQLTQSIAIRMTSDEAFAAHAESVATDLAALKASLEA